MSDLMKRREDATPKGISVLCDWFVEKAENATLWDTNGKEYIDFAAGIAVLNVGHRHPRIIEAVKKQLDRFTHTAYQVTPYESYIALAEKINELAPISGKKKLAFLPQVGRRLKMPLKWQKQRQSDMVLSLLAVAFMVGLQQQ